MASSPSEESFEHAWTELSDRGGFFTRVLEWILVGADRLLLTALLSVSTFVGFLVLGELGIVAFVNEDSITRLASGMVAGSFSLVTLVVSINQLILSREFTSAGEAESQLDDVLSFLDEIADVAFVPVSPRLPARLFELVVTAIDDRARTLAAAVEGRDDETAALVSRYANTVQNSTDRVDETVDWMASGTFQAISATIHYDDSRHLHAARYLRSRYADALSDEALDALDELIEALTLFDVAREHVKTTYLQRELTRFSQLTIALGIPSIFSALLIGFLFADLGGNTIPTAYLPFVVCALVAVVVSPLGLLVAYILRTATVARRTAATGPIGPQKGPADDPFDVQYGDGYNG